ncbi:MAG: tetratricopeptide repeat protein [Gammaproteobacteria bacterium]|nr:tetratricopeptide repeat protein [Gammaproteobacteria bacterium]
MIPRSQALRLLAVALAVAAAAAPAAERRASQAPTIGDLGNRQKIEVRKDAQVPGSASKAMENYRQFLQIQNADPKLRAEALRRLGDLSLESGELERMSNEVTQVDVQGAEAIQLYATLLKAYPDYKRNDQVLYQLARAYETTGQTGLALATLDSIVARFPQGRDSAEVQFRRGELLFSSKRYADAQQAYAAVMARGPDASTFYDQSLYKHGWAMFKQGRNEDSLDSFARLLDRTLLERQGQGHARQWERMGRADRELADDTLRVMSITFSYLDGVKSLDGFLQGRGRLPEYAWLYYSRLGDLYVEKQRFQDAAATYRAFVARAPVDVHAPRLSMQAIKAYEKGGFANLVVDGKTEFVNSYGFGQAFWRGRERRDFPEVVGQLKSNLKDLAQHHHALAQKSKRLEDYTVAARWYGEYLGSFPDDPDSAQTNYLLAEVLFESRQYASAAREYERSAYAYPLNARSAEAGYAALIAYQKQTDTLAAADRPAWHAQATDSALRFARTFPQHPESASVLTRAAQDLYAARDLPRAMQAARDLLARQPPVEAAKQRIGWTLIGQAQFDQGAYGEAEQAYARALALSAPAAAEHADITERLAAAVYRQGEAKRQAGDASGAADDFLRVARAAPGSKIVATAQYDAAAALISTQQWDRAIQVLEAYRRDYPQGEYAADVTRKLAVAYVAAGRGELAAAEFERIAAVPGEDAAVVREALGKAADLYDQAGNLPRTGALLEQLVQKYPAPIGAAIETRQRLADLAARAGNAERRRHWQREIVSADAGAGAQRTDRTRFLAAHAQLALAEPARDAFRAVRLTAPLRQSLATKKKALDAAVNAYKQVAAYNVAATTTAATYETGELYRVLAQDLLASERPKQLSAEEREQYDALLEEQAFPLEEQAIQVHEINVQRTRDGLYDDSVRKSFAALAALKPARYGKSEFSAGLLLSSGAATQNPKLAADFARAVGLYQAGRIGDAELEFKQIDLQYGGVAEAGINVGLIARQAGRLDEAGQAFRTVTERTPASAVAWNELGLTLRQQGQFAAARAAYEHAVVADPNDAAAHRNLGVLLDLYLGEAAAALPEFERYKALSGEDKPVASWIADLRARTGIKAPATAPPAPAAALPAPAAQPASAGGAP